MPGPKAKVPLWLDVDTGHDVMKTTVPLIALDWHQDAYALLLAAFHPRSHLFGISTVHGNAPVNRTTNNTKAILKAFGKEHVQLFQGESRPLQREPSFATSFHGESGLDGVSLLPAIPRTEPETSSLATKEVASLILAMPPQSVWFIPTGPLTNFARLILDYPEVVDHLAGLSIMGGAVGNKFTNAPLGTVEGEGERFGNWSPYAEFNIFCDPEAAAIVFSNPRLVGKTTLITLDLTHQCRATPAVRQQLFGPYEPLPKLRKMMEEVLLFFAQAYHQQFSISDGPPLHDPLAVLAALSPELFDDMNGERFVISMVHEGERVGQTAVTAALDGLGIRVPRGVNLESFWGSIENALNALDGQTL